MRFSSARFFQRREDYQPETTPEDSPFRRFKVSCLHCGSFRLQLKSQYDEQSGEMALVLFCPQCRQQEILPAR